MTTTPGKASPLFMTLPARVPVGTWAWRTFAAINGSQTASSAIVRYRIEPLLLSNPCLFETRNPPRAFVPLAEFFSLLVTWNIRAVSLECKSILCVVFF